MAELRRRRRLQRAGIGTFGERVERYRPGPQPDDAADYGGQLFVVELLVMSISRLTEDRPVGVGRSLGNFGSQLGIGR